MVWVVVCVCTPMLVLAGVWLGVQTAGGPAASQAAPAVSWWEQPVPWKSTTGKTVTWLDQLPRATQPPPIGSTSRLGVIRYHC